MDKELEAIKKILEALDGLEPASVKRVFDYVSSRFDNVKTNVGVEQSFSGGVMEANSGVPKQTRDVGKNIQDFLAECQPANNYQRIACLGYYLDKYRGIHEFGAKELSAANAEARLPEFSNITRDIQNAQRQYNFIRKAPGSSKKMLTVYGERIVEVLPDMSAAKVVVKEARSKLKVPKKKQKEHSK